MKQSVIFLIAPADNFILSADSLIVPADSLIVPADSLIVSQDWSDESDQSEKNLTRPISRTSPTSLKKVGPVREKIALN